MFTVHVESVGINDSGRWFISFSDETIIEFSSEDDYVAYCTGSSFDENTKEFLRRLSAGLIFIDSTNIGRNLTFNINDQNGSLVKG